MRGLHLTDPDLVRLVTGRDPDPAPSRATPQGVPIMSNNPSPTEGYYTPDRDVLEILPDGRAIIKAAGGVPVPMAEARARGLVGDDAAEGAEPAPPVLGGLVMPRPNVNPVIDQTDNPERDTNPAATATPEITAEGNAPEPESTEGRGESGVTYVDGAAPVLGRTVAPAGAEAPTRRGRPRGGSSSSGNE